VDKLPANPEESLLGEYDFGEVFHNRNIDNGLLVIDADTGDGRSFRSKGAASRNKQLI
jgi:hypothetical protein